MSETDPHTQKRAVLVVTSFTRSSALKFNVHNSVEDPDPFHFSLPDPGSKKSVKIMENSHNN